MTLLSSAFIYFSPCSSIIFACFSKAFPNEGTCYIYLLSSEGSFSSHVRYLYWSIFLDNNGDIFAASLLMLCYTFSSLILSSIVMISFYILIIRFFLKHGGLSDAMVALKTKKEYGYAVNFFVKIHKVFKFNIWWIIIYNLLKFSFIWNFHNKKIRSD